MKKTGSWLSRWGLTVSLVLFVFSVMVAAFLFSSLIALLLHFSGLLPFPMEFTDNRQGNPLAGLLILVVICILLGTTIAAFFSNRALKPIRKVIEAINRVAEGDFSSRVNVRGLPELEDLSSGFNKMAEELASIETLRSDFINDFSHEFKTPIVSIRGFARLLESSELSPEQRQEYLGIIIQESDRLADLSTNILRLSKYENIGIIADQELFRLDEQIRRTVALAEPRWSAAGLDVEVDLAPLSYLGSQDLLQQIWDNLLDNAIKFTPPGGRIHLTLEQQSDAVAFCIQDSGIGMTEATQQRVFDKFFQGDASRRQAGNGLGLAIVQRIVELCQGSIQVQSRQGSGSQFTVLLPRSPLDYQPSPPLAQPD